MPTRLLIASLVCALSACASQTARPRERAEPASAPVAFSYGTPRGELVGSETTRGRVTALLFVTTFDLPSQVAARLLDDVVRRHRPRVNAAAVVLEAPDHALLAEVFQSTLGLGYPVLLATTPGVQHQGPFGTIDRVPTLVVLDKKGREVLRRSGVLSSEQIDEALGRAERR